LESELLYEMYRLSPFKRTILTKWPKEGKDELQTARCWKL